MTRLQIDQPPVRAHRFRDRAGRGAEGFRSRRVAALTAFGLVAVIAAILLISSSSLSPSGPVQAARARAQLVADSLLRVQLRPADLRSPVSPARRRTLGRLFHTHVLVDGITRASLYGADRRITYSTQHSLIGRTVPTATLSPTSTVVATAGTGQAGPHNREVLIAYAPLSIRSPTPTGGLALVQLYVSPAGEGALPFILLSAVVGLALLALYFASFPVPRHVSNRAHVLTQRMEDMERRAFHDMLTGLPNRELFHRRVAEAIAGIPENGVTVAVMLMDLDRFKEVNDTFGHQSGDRLLREVAAHLRGALRAQDTVARLGGDEFAILCSPVAGSLGAVALAQHVLEKVQGSHTVDGVEVDVDASIGIALCPLHGETVDELLRCADIAMYESKASGAPTLFARELDHHSIARLTLGSQLRRAITNCELAVYFQPKADFGSGQISSVEALVRWQHPDHGLLPPEQFIQVAEQTGLIRPLTTYVLNAALEQCHAWRRSGVDLAVAVNITGRDLLDHRFAEEVKDLLRSWEVMPSRLELEITENTVFADPVRARTVLMTLHKLGVRLAIDDFGSGHSSLSYITRLPIDVLKIDKSFVMKMHENEDDAAIVRSTIDLGHNLGLKVVAEGVSTVTAWDRLRGLGCDVAQGYYLSKPVSGADIAALITAEGPRGPRRRDHRADIAAAAERNVAMQNHAPADQSERSPLAVSQIRAPTRARER